MAENTRTLNVIADQSTGKILQTLPEAHLVADKPMKVWQGTTGAIDETESNNNTWANWGIADNRPTEFREKLQKCNMASAVIARLIASMYGNGIIYYNNDDLYDGNTTVQRAYNPAVEEFLRKNRIRTAWYPAQCADYRYHMNAFSEMIFSNDRKSIVGLAHKAAEFTRIGKQNPKTLKIDKAYYSPYFRQGYEPPREKLKELPYFLSHEYYFDEPDGRYFRRVTRSGKFLWHSLFETPGRTYYAEPWWMPLFEENGWLDVAINVPRIITAMQNNQVSIKYQILIPESYFTTRYADWDSYTDEAREKIMKQLDQGINDMLSGTDNQYKSITSYFRDNPNFSQPQGKIEIVAIDDKAKTGTWIPDSNAADAQIVQGLGMHPSQMGLAPEGGKMGAGSGSDQRESYNTQIQNNTIDQAILLEPLNFISEFNGWNVTFVIDHSTHTTTNKQESGIQPSENTLQVE